MVTQSKARAELLNQIAVAILKGNGERRPMSYRDASQAADATLTNWEEMHGPLPTSSQGS